MSRRHFLATAGAAPLSSGVQPKSRRPKTKFAVNVETWWTDRPFLARIDAAAAAGFPAIEFWPWRDKDIDAIGAKAREHGLVITQFTAWGFEPGMNDPENHDDVVSEIKASCATAKKLGAKLVTVVAGDDQPGMSQEEMHGNVIVALKRVAPIAEDNDVTLILEPMNIRVDHAGHCLYGSAPAIRIVEAVGPTHVKINWDLYHLQITEGDLCGHLAEGIDHIGYVQLADHPGRNEPGTGEVHYNRVLQELDRLGYGGYVGLELTPLTSETEAAEAVARADVW